MQWKIQMKKPTISVFGKTSLISENPFPSFPNTKLQKNKKV